MAKVKGIFQIVGTLGDINFYMHKGKQVARKAGGGFNSESIKTKASMEKVRQNGTEFGRVAGMVKAFRHGITPLLFSNRFPELHSQLMRLFTSIKNEDTLSERGKREFLIGLGTVLGNQMMTGFTISAEESTFQAIHSQVRFDWESMRLHFSSPKASLFSFPKNVAALSIQVAVFHFSDAGSGILLPLSEVVFVSPKDTLPESIVVPVDSPIDGRSMAIVTLHHYERNGQKLQPIALKNAFYLEVVSIQ